METPGYLLVHPFLGATAVVLILTAYALKASARKFQTVHYWVGLSAFSMMVVGVTMAVYALVTRTKELGEFPPLYLTFQPHYYIALALFLTLLTEVILGLSMRFQPHSITNFRLIHWRLSQLMLVEIFFLTIFGVPVFWDLLAGSPFLQALVLFTAFAFLVGLIVLYSLLERNSLRVKKIRKISRPSTAEAVEEKGIYAVNFLPDSITVSLRPSQSILQASLRAGLPHIHACGGNARCSTCRVLILEGVENCLPRNRAEENLARTLGFSPQVRLACQTRISGNVRLRRLVLDEDDIRLTSQIQKDVTPMALGKEEQVAILFADIEGFTGFAEMNLPYDVIYALNRYYRKMGEVIESYDGQIINYMGDGLMALFGLRRTHNPSLNAIRAAFNMQATLEKDKKYFEAAYRKIFNIRIGIHYGAVVVGDLGSVGHRQISAIGDAVNLANRIEEANKEAGTKILVSEDVYSRIQQNVTIGKLFSITPKGKTGTYPLFEIVSISEPQP